jgi:hypothetical protein
MPRDYAHYRRMFRERPAASVGFALAASAIYAARNGQCEDGDRETDEWRHVARNLKSTEGEDLAAARVLALMAEARGQARADWIQQTVIDRASALGLSAYAIAQRTAGAVSADHVLAYLARRKSMGSHKLQHVLTALRLTIRVEE